MPAVKTATQTISVPLSREVRPDGGLRVTSPDLPGLLLSHSDPGRVLGGLEAAVRWNLGPRLAGPITRVVVHPDRADVEYGAG